MRTSRSGRIKFENLQSNANIALIKARGRLEPRTVIDVCEQVKLVNEQVPISFNRAATWRAVYYHPSFQRYKSIVDINAPCIRRATEERKGWVFGDIVKKIYSDRSIHCHTISGSSIVIPPDFNQTDRAAMISICSYLGVEYELP